MAVGNDVRFALYRRQALTQSLPCMILLLVDEKMKTARIVAQDQNGTALIEVAGAVSSTLCLLVFWHNFLPVQPQVHTRTRGSFLTIGAEIIKFNTSKGTVSLPQNARRCSVMN